MNAQNEKHTKRTLLTHAVAAFLISALLLALSGFAPIQIARGGTPAETMEGVRRGDYVRRDIPLILDYFATASRGDRVTQKYAVVPAGGELVAVSFPKRWFVSADTIHNNTTALFTGTSMSLDQFITVRGTAVPMPEEVSAQLYDWFDSHREWMQQTGLLGEAEDAADILPDLMIRVDTIGVLPDAAAVLLSVASGLCLLYAILALVHALRRPKPEREIAVELSEETPAEAPESGSVTVELVTGPEDAAEAPEDAAEAPEDAPEAPEHTEETPDENA